MDPKEGSDSGNEKAYCTVIFIPALYSIYTFIVLSTGVDGKEGTSDDIY